MVKIKRLVPPLRGPLGEKRTLPPCGAEAVSAVRSQRTPVLRLLEARPAPKRVVLPLMNEAKKPPSSEGDGVHIAASPGSSSRTRSLRESTP